MALGLPRNGSQPCNFTCFSNRNYPPGKLVRKGHLSVQLLCYFIFTLPCAIKFVNIIRLRLERIKNYFFLVFLFVALLILFHFTPLRDDVCTIKLNLTDKRQQREKKWNSNPYNIAIYSTKHTLFRQ